MINMTLHEAIKSNKILSEDAGKRDIVYDFIQKYCDKYSVNIMIDNEKKIIKHLSKLLNEISEAVTMLSPTKNVIVEKIITMPIVVNKIIERIEKRFEIDDFLLKSVSTLSKKNVPELIKFNKILLKQLRNYLHGYHSCGRMYDFRKKRDENYTTDVYKVCTLDSFNDLNAKKVFKEHYNISIYKKIASVYWEKRKNEEAIFEYREGFKIILNKKELTKFLTLLFEGRFATEINYNSSYTAFGKKRLDAF